MIIQGVLLSSVVKDVEIKGVKIPVIFEKDSSLPIVSMQVVFRNSGSLFSGEKDGLSKFVASMLNEGTKKDGAIGFAKKLEDEAINYASSTGNETFVFEMSSLKKQFPKGIELLSELLSDPNFTEPTLKKVRLLKKSLLKQKEDDFDHIASVNLRKVLFPDTPLAKSFIGTQESLDAITIKDVQEFYKKHIVLKRAVIVIGGDVEFDEAKEFLKKLLSGLDVGEDEKLPYYETTKKPTTKEIYKDTKQAYIYFGSPYNLSATDKDYYKARVATFILGAGGFGSRLLEEIRVKRGLAYSAYTSLSVNLTNRSMRGYLQTKIENQKKAIELVKEVISNFVKDGVTKKELESAKKFLLGSEPLRSETLSQRLSNTFLTYYKGLPLDSYKKDLKKIEELKLEDLNSFIHSHDEINSLSFSIVTKK
jgi:predicted Zn-dependent peptidase